MCRRIHPAGQTAALDPVGIGIKTENDCSHTAWSLRKQEHISNRFKLDLIHSGIKNYNPQKTPWNTLCIFNEIRCMF